MSATALKDIESTIISRMNVCRYNMTFLVKPTNLSEHSRIITIRLKLSALKSILG